MTSKIGTAVSPTAAISPTAAPASATTRTWTSRCRGTLATTTMNHPAANSIVRETRAPDGPTSNAASATSITRRRCVVRRGKVAAMIGVTAIKPPARIRAVLVQPIALAGEGSTRGRSCRRAPQLRSCRTSEGSRRGQGDFLRRASVRQPRSWRWPLAWGVVVVPRERRASSRAVHRRRASGSRSEMPSGIAGTNPQG